MKTIKIITVDGAIFYGTNIPDYYFQTLLNHPQVSRVELLNDSFIIPPRYEPILINGTNSMVYAPVSKPFTLVNIISSLEYSHAYHKGLKKYDKKGLQNDFHNRKLAALRKPFKK